MVTWDLDGIPLFGWHPKMAPRHVKFACYDDSKDFTCNRQCSQISIDRPELVVWRCELNLMPRSRIAPAVEISVFAPVCCASVGTRKSRLTKPSILVEN